MLASARLLAAALARRTLPAGATEAAARSAGGAAAGGSRRTFAADAPPPPADPDAAATAHVNPLMRAPVPGGGGAPPASPSSAPPPPAPRPDAVATLRGVRISPKKLARFARSVAGLHVDDALAQCALSPTKAARIAAGVIASARANAAANHGLGTSLSVAEAVVGRAATATRPWFHGKGRTGVRSLYRSHLHIRLAPAARGPVTRFIKPLLERRPPKRGREGGAAA